MQRISDKGYIQFGYYCGHTIEKIPDSYLDWILADFDIESEEDSALFEAATKEKERRTGANIYRELRIKEVDEENKTIIVEPISGVIVAEGQNEKDKG